MKKSLILFLLSALFVTSLIAANSKAARLLQDYKACFILYDLNHHQIVSEYNPNNYCDQRISPDSTFKIALSLMAFDQGVINQNTRFKWDGKKGVIPEHDRDQNPNTWLKYSVLWVSQQITPKLGQAKIQRYLQDFHYGNQDFSGDPGRHNGLTHAWLSSSLKISGFEQLHFLEAMLSNKLPLAKQAIENTEKNLYLGQLDNGADYYGKTGAGRNGRNERLANPSLLRDGWFVGFIKQGQQQYIFISNLTDKTIKGSINKADGSLTPFGSQILKPITLALLNDYFASNQLPNQGIKLRP